jgi:hypothetical protein
MPILHPNAPEHDLPPKVVVPTEASIELLEAPKRKLRRRRNMPIILWTLLLVFGILILLVRTPPYAPPFDSLTQYVCDPLPRLPNLGNRFQSYALRLRCRSGEQVLYRRESAFDGSNPGGLYACRREGGLTRIWRMRPPTEYGAYVSIPLAATTPPCTTRIVPPHTNPSSSFPSPSLTSLSW